MTYGRVFADKIRLLVEKIIDNRFKSLPTPIPAEVIRVRDNFTYLSVDVKPLIKPLGGEELPPILNVPVQMPSSKRSSFILPVEEGDNVLLIFSKYGLDTWKRSNGRNVVEPMDARVLSYRDCFALTGIFPFKESPNLQSRRNWSHNTQDLVITHNHGTDRETEVRLKSDGGVVINTKQPVTVNSPQINLGEESDLEPSVLGKKMWEAMEKLKLELDTHQHIGNLGAPTSPAMGVKPFEMEGLLSGGDVYSKKNKNQ